MATLKDFVVNRGLVVNTQAVINGVDVLANDGVTLLSAYANDVATLNTLRANDFNSYTTLNGRINTVQDNVGSIIANYSANDYVTWLAAMANDYSTYTTLNGRINTVQDNVGSIVANYSANDYVTWLAATANDGVTLASARANDYSTYTTLVSEYKANDYATWLSATANDGATLLSARSNDHVTWLAAQANDGVTLDSARANDYSTYTTLVSAYQSNDYATLLSAYANDVSTLNTARANDYATLLSAQANDGVTLLNARSNDYTTYTTLVNEYQANDNATYNTLLNGYRANDYATWNGLNSYTNIKANSDVNVIAGSGLSGGGALTGNVTLSVDSTVVRTTGAQNIGGLKTFTDSIVISGDLTVEGNTTTIGTTSLLVEDKFIELASNTTGVPSGDVGVYLNRGNEGNSAIYYDQSEGYFALVNTLDPATNTVVSPTGYAALRIGTLIVSNTQVVTNLNADQLDGQSGSYYLDFGNLTNTGVITLDRVLANGNSSSHSISVGGLTVDANTFHVDSTNNFVGVRTLTPLAPLQVEAVGFDTSFLATTTTTANQVLDSFAAASFRTAKYTIQVHDTANNYYHSCEILLIHDGATVYMTEYAIVYTSVSLASFNADISGGNVRLLVTPTNNTNNIRVVRSTLLV